MPLFPIQSGFEVQITILSPQNKYNIFLSLSFLCKIEDMGEADQE